MKRLHVRRVINATLTLILLFSCLRLLLLAFAVSDGGVASAAELALALAIGLVNDTAVIFLLGLPLLAFRGETPFRLGLTGTFFLAGLCMISEVIFWSEFHSRFNFIAVDYLVYTQEVLHNIWESYPVVPVLLSLLAVSVAAGWFVSSRRWEIAGFGRAMVAATIAIGFLSLNQPYAFSSAIAREIAKNGLASLVGAYFENQIDYPSLYKIEGPERSFTRLKSLLAGESGAMNEGRFDIGREIKGAGPMRKHNVVLISMESMSAKFLSAFGGREGLTPNLDRLAREGVLFTNIFATGTRTVRGLEALLLSVPPTPGQAIVRRPKSKYLFNVADYLVHAGYATEFLYGGNSYFDNMKEFFTSNEMTVADRADIPEDQVTFANAWGVCDEDLFALAMKRADSAALAGTPFFQMIMTTSNHRPYTYPQKIDLPSGKGRAGAVKYADYAIGAYLRDAATRAWYKNTVFVFVADHDASVAGNIDVPIHDFRIPFIIYAPSLMNPRKIDRLGSQIDVGPTVLGALNTTYKSHLFGHSLFGPGEDRALLGTYQKVGYLKNSVLTLLGPNRSVEQFSISPGDKMDRLKILQESLVSEAIAYYESASYLFTSGGMKDNGDDKVL